MGYFSWKRSDDGKPIRNRYTEDGPTPVKMIDDKGNEWIELDYDGYGMFGGKDYYELVDEMNGGRGDRLRGIDLCLCFDETPPDVREPRLVSPNCRRSWDELPPPRLDPLQGYWDA